MNPLPATDYIVAAIFYFCVATTAGGALLAVLTRHIIRSVCGLMICCLGLAGLYYFLHSPFLALMEILIYIGAVCVTIMFAVMLTEPAEPARGESRGAAILWGTGALAVGVAICWGLSRLGLAQHWTPPAALANNGSVEALGISLLTTYSMAFELISLVLLVAIIGALVIARPGRRQS
jgi:NADH-quinone oxidoreductase subunit J